MSKRPYLGFAFGVAATAAYALVVRPWFLHWGMREEPEPRALAGDEIVPRPRYETTRAIAIHAPASRVWQWLVQIGVGRGGFYTYDALENLAGLNIASANRIRPEWQSLAAGDNIHISPVTPLKIETLETNHALVLHTVMDPRTAKVVDPSDPSTRAFIDWTWAFVLEQITPARTRLIVRVRADFQPDEFRLAGPLLLEPIHFIMERGMLQGIKKRAERDAIPAL